MKHVLLPFLALLILVVSSCQPKQKSQEELRAECDSLLNLADNAVQSMLFSVAISYCNQAIAIDSTYPENYYTKGYTYFCDKCYDSSIVAYEKCYQLDNRLCELSEVMFQMAYAYNELKRYDDALRIAQEGLLSNPEDIELMDIISTSYALQEKYIQAEYWAERELNTHKNDGRAFFRLAWLNQAQGRTNKAIEYYEKILEMNPDESSTLWNLSILYYYSDRQKAISLLKKAARLGEENARTWCKENGIDY